MAHKVIDRCKETTSTTGTGNLTLTGAVTGFTSVASTLTANGDTSWFCAEAGSQWEIFLGTRVSATELARTTLISSSTGSTVNFTAPPVVFSTVPGNKVPPIGPVFSAGKTTAQSLSPGTTKITFTTVEYDTHSAYDTGTSKFQPQVPGYYTISANVGWNPAISANCILLVYKNGAAYKQGPQPNNSNYGLGASVTVYLNGSTDYVEIYVYVSASASIPASAPNSCWFQGNFVRGA